MKPFRFWYFSVSWGSREMCMCSPFSNLYYARVCTSSRAARCLKAGLFLAPPPLLLPLPVHLRIRQWEVV